MEFLYEYGLFLLKAVTFVVAVIIVVSVIVGAGMKQKPATGVIKVDKINDRFDDMQNAVKQAVMDEDKWKKEQKAAEKEKKRAKKQAKDEPESSGKRVFLAEFNGDMKASAVDQLREVVSAILLTATEQDEVVIKLESAGGMVHSYGLASSQLDRIRQHNIPLTVCVDKVAASGGYMMACVANKICAAPFAVIGSIGVVAQLPNFHKLLKKNDIDFELMTAGEYKRTLTVFGENTDKARQKFTEDLELTHQLFKDYVQQQRPSVPIEEVATGEVWFGIKAKEHQLVDELTTSDDYVMAQAADHDVYQVAYVKKKSFPERIGMAVESSLDRVMTRLIEQCNITRFFH